MTRVLNIPVSRLSVAQVVQEINKHTDGRNVKGIFFNPTSLLKGNLEIYLDEPRVIEVEKIVEVEKEVIKEIPLKVINQVKKQRGASSQYRGVAKKGDRYYAMIQRNGKKYWLGSYTSELEAAEAYDKKAIELLGKGAILNFPQEELN